MSWVCFEFAEGSLVTLQPRQTLPKAVSCSEEALVSVLPGRDRRSHNARDSD